MLWHLQAKGFFGTMVIHPLKLRDSQNPRDDGFGPKSRSLRRFIEVIRKDGIFCAHCFNLVTYKHVRIQRKGSHVHTFANPAGHVYEIGCFSQARGCTRQGPVCNDFTWFSGYSWQVVVCSECLVHLGWIFSAQSRKSFFGLILNQLHSFWEED